LPTKLVIFRQVKKYRANFVRPPNCFCLLRLWINWQVYWHRTKIRLPGEDTATNRMKSVQFGQKYNQPLEMLRMIRKWCDCKHHEMDL